VHINRRIARLGVCSSTHTASTITITCPSVRAPQPPSDRHAPHNIALCISRVGHCEAEVTAAVLRPCHPRWRSDGWSIRKTAQRIRPYTLMLIRPGLGVDQVRAVVFGTPRFGQGCLVRHRPGVQRPGPRPGPGHCGRVSIAAWNFRLVRSYRKKGMCMQALGEPAFLRPVRRHRCRLARLTSQEQPEEEENTLAATLAPDAPFAESKTVPGEASPQRRLARLPPLWPRHPPPPPAGLLP
jgi:hypothetical protein